jgi:hypothetical protein
MVSAKNIGVTYPSRGEYELMFGVSEGQHESIFLWVLYGVGPCPIFKFSGLT